MTDAELQRPRVRFAALYALVLIAVLYAVHLGLRPGFPYSLLLAPALLGQGLILGFLGSAGLDLEGGFARALAWAGGGLVLWYVYYKLIYLVLWLFGVHQPIRPGADPDAAPERDREGGWLVRTLLVLLVPGVLVVMTWQAVTSYDNQYERQHDLVRKAADAACGNDEGCQKRVRTRFDACFDQHFVQDGRRWFRAHYALAPAPFRACLVGAKPVSDG